AVMSHDVATPLASVFTFVLLPVNEPDGPLFGVSNVTFQFGMPLPYLSVTFAFNFLWNLPVASVFESLPSIGSRNVGTSGLFVRCTFAGAGASLVCAVRSQPPATVFAVTAGAVAMPLASVVADAEPENVADAPVAGVLNVTNTPGTG